MTDQIIVEVDSEEEDQEYAEAYGFWIFVFGVAGALAGFNLGAEWGFSFWSNVGLAALGFTILASVAYTFRKAIAMIGAVVILITVVMAVIEGIRSA
jgi:hypothetical protein